MIRWEPIPGQATGFAVFGRNGKREWRLPVPDIAHFDMLQREFEHQGNQKIAVIYWDVVNEVRRLAEKRTTAATQGQKNAGGKRSDD